MYISQFDEDERLQRPTVFLTSFCEETFTRIKEKCPVGYQSDTGQNYFPGKIRRMTGKDAADVCSQIPGKPAKLRFPIRKIAAGEIFLDDEESHQPLSEYLTEQNLAMIPFTMDKGTPVKTDIMRKS